MANVLTNLFPDLYAAIDVVSRELVGFIPAVSRNSDAERAAKGQTVRVPVTSSETSRDITPGPNVPDDGDTTVNNRTVTISKSKAVPVRFNGEEQRGLKTGGTYNEVRRDRFAQAMRTLVNEIEGDLGGLYLNASQAYGTAGTTPFGTKDDLTDFAGVAKVLDENGAPPTNRQLVAGSAAWFNLRGKQAGILQKANEAGTDAALRNGEFGDVHGITLRNSAGIQSHTTGSVTDVTANANTVGTTDVDVQTAGTSGDISLNEGDLITFAGDDHKYTVAADTSAGAGVASTTIPIREPGLKEATADGDAVSAVANYVANAAFHRNALQLATRVPAVPEEGDKAMDRTIVQDPLSGLAFDVAAYPGYHEIHYEVSMAWGFAATKEEHLVLLLG